MSTEDGWARLGQIVVSDRVKRGMKTTKALAERMGISPRLAGDIENGRRTSYSSGTKAALEGALDWAPGSVDIVIAGGAPRRLTVIEHSGDLRFGPAPARTTVDFAWPMQDVTLEAAVLRLRNVSQALQEAWEDYALAAREADAVAAQRDRALDRRVRLQEEQGRLNALIDELRREHHDDPSEPDVLPDEVARRRRALKADQIAADEVPSAARPEEER